MAKTDECKHNKAVECRDHSACNHCGWKKDGPEAMRRKNYIKKHQTNAGMMKKENAEIIQKSYRIGAIVATNLSTGESVRYKSVAEACDGTAFRMKGIYCALNGKRAQYKGWKFERVDVL